MFILSNKVLDTTVLTASVVDTPDSNLTNPLPSSKWRLSTPEPIKLNNASGIDADTIAFSHTNAKTGDWIRIRAADTEANLTAAPTYDKNFYLAPGQSGGFFGTARYNGSSSVTSFGPILDQTTGSFTIEVRTCVQGAIGGGRIPILSKKQSAGSADAGYELFVTNAAIYRFQVADGIVSLNADSTTPASTTCLTVSMVVDASVNKAYIYINGQLEGQVDTTGLGSLTNAENFLIAKEGGAVFGQVDISEVRFFSRAVPAAEILSGYSQPIDVNSPLPSGLELLWRADEMTGSTATDDSASATNGSHTDVTYLSDAPPNVSADLSSWATYGVHCWADLSTTINDPWLQIDIYYDLNAEGFFQTSHLFIGTKFTPITAFSGSWLPNTVVRGLSSNPLSDGGLSQAGGSIKRNPAFNLLNLTKTEFWGVLDPIIRDRKSSRLVFVVLTPTEQTYPMAFTFMGYIDADIQVLEPNRVTAAITITEP